LGNLCIVETNTTKKDPIARKKPKESNSEIDQWTCDPIKKLIVPKP